MRIPLLLAPLLCLCACSDVGTIPGPTQAGSGPYPELISIAALNARANAVMVDTTDTALVEARVARLEARAALLRGAPVDDATRARLAAFNR